MGPPRLPPAKMVEVAAESKNEIPELIPAHPVGQIFRRKPAIPFGCPPHPAFDIPVALQTPTYLARVPDGRVVGPTVAVLTSADRVLADVSLDWGHPGLEHFAYRRFRLPRCQDIQGSALLLACTGADTYFHWLTDSLPRLDIAAKARGLDWFPDFFIVNTTIKRFVEESLSILKIPPERVLSLENNPHIRFKTLWVPSLPSEGSSGNPPYWVQSFLKGLFKSSLKTNHEEDSSSKIWIDRSSCKRRKLFLSDNLKKEIKSLGFSIVKLENISLQDQINLFLKATVVAGPHGGGFTNTIFSDSPCSFEIFEPDYVNACYYALNQLADGTYRYSIASFKDYRDIQIISFLNK